MLDNPVLCSNSAVFSRSQFFLSFSLGSLCWLFVLIVVTSVSIVWLFCCSRHFTPNWKTGSREQKAFSFQVCFLFRKQIFLKSPSQISYISWEGAGLQGSLGNLAKGNGVDIAWVGHIVSPNKIRALLGRKTGGVNSYLYAMNHACHMLWNLKLFVSLYKECTPEIYSVSALCLSWWRFSSVILLNKLCGLLNWMKTS